MSWTKKHDEFCLRQKLRPSTRLLLRWLLRRAKLYEIFELEIDLKKFNAWVARERGQEYDRKTIREAIAQLDEMTDGLIVVYRSYTPWVKKLIVRPLSFVVEKQLPNMGKSPTTPTGNPMFDADHKKRLALQQQQDISKIDSLFREVGITFTTDAIIKIWRTSGKCLDSITQAVELLLHRHSVGKTKITNPQGFIVDCLKHGWQKGFNLYYQAELPFFNSAADIGKFVAGIKDKIMPKPDNDPLRIAQHGRFELQT